MEFIFGEEKKFFQFFGDLDEKDKIAIFSHNDADGIMSAVIASKVLGKIDFIKFLDYTPDSIKLNILELKKKKINKLFIFDYSCENEKEAILEISKFCNVLILDHHQWKTDLNSEKIIILVGEDNYPASYISYYLFSKTQEVDSRYAALGICSDLPHKYQENNIQSIFQDFNLKKKEINLWRSMNILSLSLIYFKNMEEKVYGLLMENSGFSLSSLEKYSNIIEKEINKYFLDFEKNKEEKNKLVFYSYSPKYTINSYLITSLSLKNKDKIFVFICNYNGDLRISARNQNKNVNCLTLLEQACKDIPNSHPGGHIAAAGVKIENRYLDKFKNNLFNLF